MSGSHIFFNGVLMRDCETHIKQELIYEDSNTDILHCKSTITASSMLIGLADSRPPSDAIGSGPGGINAPLSTIALPIVSFENIVDRWREVQWRLHEPREDFWLALNGVTSSIQPSRGTPPADDGSTNASYRIMLAATGLSVKDLQTLKDDPNASIGMIKGFHNFGLGTPTTQVDRLKVIDSNNGPKPISVEINQICGGRALHVTFTIEICRCYCMPSGSVDTDTVPPVMGAGKVVGVISNKWSLSEALDSDWRTEHAIEGKLVVSDARYKPHAYRLMVQPQLFPYAKMVSRKFTSDKSELVLAYQFNIKETGPAAPYGVVDWDGTYTERFLGMGKKLADVSVRVTGQVNPVLAGANAIDPGQEHKAALLNAAFAIARSRIRWSSLHNPLPGKVPKQTITDNAICVDRMEKSTVELHVAVIYNDAAPGGGVLSDDLGLRLASFGKSIKDEVQNTDPEYDPRYWPNPKAFPWDIATAKDDSEEQDTGSYFFNYFQTPCSEWHATPKGAAPPDSIAREEVQTDDTLEMDYSLTALDPEGPGQVISPAMQGWADGQVDFAYYQVELENEYVVESGRIQIPLSAPQYGTGHTSVFPKLYPGMAQRELRMVVSRIGDWPKFPAPQTTVMTGGITETYLKGNIIREAPKLTPDGKTYLYSLQVKWLYGLSRIPNQPGDLLRAPSSPADKTTPTGNQIKISDYITFNEVDEGINNNSGLFG